MTRKRRTKIIATLGPRTDDINLLQQLIEAGVDSVRLNFSHGTIDDHQRRVSHVREIASTLHKEISIIGDLQGPKIRIGTFKNKSVVLHNGAPFILDASLTGPGDAYRVGIDYKALPDDVRSGDTLLLNDGAVQCAVDSVEGPAIYCTVIQGGELSDHKGINRLGGGLSAKALTEKDISDLKAAINMGVDYIAISFPRDAADMEQAREMIRAAGGTQGLIAKIERVEAIKAIDEIINASDVVMVARGDLGVEIGDAEVPFMQKHIIQRARSLDKAVITATQMLESMISHATPTRAEVSDVANAVLDGTDAVMLSAETATGDFPVEAVAVMHRVCFHAEGYPATQVSGHRMECQFHQIDEAIAMAAMYTANHFNVKAIIALTESGSTPLWMSRIRSGIPIYALSRHVTSQRRMTLYRGVYPLSFDPTNVDRRDVVRRAIDTVRTHGFIADGDRVIVTKGNVMGTLGGTNAMKIHIVGEDGN